MPTFGIRVEQSLEFLTLLVESWSQICFESPLLLPVPKISLRTNSKGKDGESPVQAWASLHIRYHMVTSGTLLFFLDGNSSLPLLTKYKV